MAGNHSILGPGLVREGEGTHASLRVHLEVDHGGPIPLIL